MLRHNRRTQLVQQVDINHPLGVRIFVSTNHRGLHHTSTNDSGVQLPINQSEPRPALCRPIEWSGEKSGTFFMLLHGVSLTGTGEKYSWAASRMI